jgi:isoleucyl-tRNA synthetase
VRRVVTGALEIERRERRIGSSLEAAPEVHIGDADLARLLKGIDLAEISITSDAKLIAGPVPACAFRLDDVRHVGVVPRLATGRKCERSWRIRSDIGADAAFPTLSKRDAAAVREWQARGAGA